MCLLHNKTRQRIKKVKFVIRPSTVEYFILATKHNIAILSNIPKTNNIMGALQGPLRWGFFGAGKITSDFVTVLSELSDHRKHVPVGIAARDGKRAKSFAESHGILKSYQSYQQLVEDPEIDVVYIGTVNSEHYYQAKMAVEHSKHVLVEKPICANAKQCQDLMDAARRHGVFLMEGLWTAAFPATRKFFSEIQNGSIGDIVSVILEAGRGAEFCKIDRFQKNELCGGVLMNHGIYGLLLNYLLLGKPDVVTAVGHLAFPEGIDHTVTATMSFHDKACISTLILTARANLPGDLCVTGTKGVAKIPFPFWAPTVCETPNGTFTYDLPQICQGKTFNYMRAQGFKYEIDEVYERITEGKMESPLVPWEASLQAMKIADEIRRQIGVKFPQD